MQFLRPNADIANPGGWAATPVGPLFVPISDATWDMSRRIALNVGTTGQYLRLGLQNGADPNLSTGHVVHVIATQLAGNQGGLTMRLKEGATARAVENWLFTVGVIVELTYTLSGAEADSIASYPDLELELEPVIVLGGFEARIYQAWLQIPDAGFSHIAPSGPGLISVGNNSGSYLSPNGPGLQLSDGLEGVGSVISGIARGVVAQA